MKEIFKSIVNENIKRNGIEELMDMLERTDFYTAPASRRYHDSEEGGLVKHSVDVFEILDSDLHKDDVYSMESKAIIALFHDICKVGYYKVEMRNTKDEKGKWIQVPYYTIDDQLPLGHGAKSIIMIREYMKLTTEEMMAIMWHMGLSVPKEEYNSMSSAFKQYPLALHLHIADMKSTYL